MVLVCSGLKTNRDRIMYKNFIKKFDLKEKNAIDKNVTHLVVSVNPQNCADRTLKFLQAITNKCWIISLTWVQECLTQDTLFIPESFEVLDTNNQPGPNRSRHGLLYIWMELLSIFFVICPHEAGTWDPNYTLGWIFWTMIFDNLKKFTSRSI